MTPMKHYFVKHFLDYSEILAGDVTLMPDKVLKVLRRYMLLFFEQSVKYGRRRGVIFAPRAPRIYPNLCNLFTRDVFQRQG